MTHYPSIQSYAQIPREFELSDPPTDGISSLAFQPRQHASQSSLYLLATSWDATVRIYDTLQMPAVSGASSLFVEHALHQAPVLDGCWFPDGNQVVTAGLDRQVIRYDLGTMMGYVVGRHEENAIRCVVCIQYMGQTLIVSGGWDGLVRFWDPQGVSVKDDTSSIEPLLTLRLPGRVLSMDKSKAKQESLKAGESMEDDRYLVVALSERWVYIYDLSDLPLPKPPSTMPIRDVKTDVGAYAYQKRESSLKYQIRCIRCFPRLEKAVQPDYEPGFVLSSIEGRVAVEYISAKPEIQAKKYAFKCHRKPHDGKDYVYPVHVVQFHPIYGTFATGGGDGMIAIWDPIHKKRLRTWGGYKSSIAAVSFSPCGSLIAVASSYMWEEGEKDHEPDSIFIRPLADVEVWPKHLQ